MATKPLQLLSFMLNIVFSINYKLCHEYLKKILIPFFLVLLLNIPSLSLNIAHADEENYWKQNVNVFNFSCTDGDIDCWTDERNALEKLPLVEYAPLKASEVNKKHHICVSFPHLKDSYWVGVAYGIISESIFSTLVFVILGTIFIGPILLRYSFKKNNEISNAN